MAFGNTLEDVVHRLRQGMFSNEQAVSQGVVLRLLSELGWDTWDTTTVWPEYQTGEGRADFALCHPPSKPAVLIEVKQLGKAEDAVRQALEYAFHTGVTFVVLTDGRTWSFYLPAEQGSYEDRRVYKLDLFERSTQEASEILTRYLMRSRIESEEAIATARAEYRSRNRTAQARATIPEAWQELVGKGDELLVDLVASAVESRIGIRPNVDDVAEFLIGLRRHANPDIRRAPLEKVQPEVHQPSSQAQRATPDSTRAGTLVLLGGTYAYGNAKEAMVLVLRKLAERDPLFLDKCSQHPDVQGRKRRYIARTSEELYPDRPDLSAFKEALPGGWFVATNLNNVLKRTIVKMGAEVAGITWGRDLIVDL